MEKEKMKELLSNIWKAFYKDNIVIWGEKEITSKKELIRKAWEVCNNAKTPLSFKEIKELGNNKELMQEIIKELNKESYEKSEQILSLLGDYKLLERKNQKLKTENKTLKEENKILKENNTFEDQSDTIKELETRLKYYKNKTWELENKIKKQDEVVMQLQTENEIYKRTMNEEELQDAERAIRIFNILYKI